MFNDLAGVLDCLERGFHGKRLLVIGDLMLDRHLWGKVSRISPEAPVPVVKITADSETAGGAGNVALNVAGLGLKVAVCGFVGEDTEGERLRRLMSDCGVNTRGVLTGSRRTTTKTRVIGGHQQMLRMDQEDVSEARDDECARLRDAIMAELADGVAAVILSDYAKGALSDELCRTVVAKARELGIPVFADSKGTDYSKFHGATAITPNRAEISAAGRVPPSDLDAIMGVARALRSDIGLDFVLVTLGEAGLALVRDESVQQVPAVARDVFDVSGAGDTVIATMAAGLAAGLGLDDAVCLANLAAGVVVGKAGTVAVRRKELLDAIAFGQALQLSDKICTLDVLIGRMEKWRAQGETIVFTNGCFDVLHAGHVTYLQKARQEGDRLIVGLNSDRSVRRLKGESRPIIAQDQRALVLAALASVDAVILFDEDTPVNLIKATRPDILAKGSDYSEDQVAGGSEVKSWGGRVVLVDLVEGQSTTTIVSRIAEQIRTGQ